MADPQPVVANAVFAFQAHSVDNGGTGPSNIVAMDASVMNPGFLTDTDVVLDRKKDPADPDGLQEIVDAMLQRIPKLAALRFALVDLTTEVNLPALAGNKMTLQGGLGSMAKIAIMFTAYQLKFDLEQLAKAQKLKDKDALFKAARDRWVDTQKDSPGAKTKEIHPGDATTRMPKLSLRGDLFIEEPTGGKESTIRVPATASFPNLERIFDVTSSGSGGDPTIEFKGADLIQVGKPGAPVVNDAARRYVARTKDNITEADKLTFAERLWLSIDESDNAASHTCIRDLGFIYIGSSLFQSDLYNPKRGGGLWEGASHRGTTWQRSFVPGTGRSAPAFQNSTPAAVASFMTLLAQGRLVNAASSKAMLDLMSKRKSATFGSFTRSFLGEGLRFVSPGTRSPRFRFSLKTIHSKLGIGDFDNDCVLIERDDRSKTLKYAAAAFDDPNVDADHLLHELAVELDKCIQQHNGLAPQDTP
jgi:hypothetical protein